MREVEAGVRVVEPEGGGGGGADDGFAVGGCGGCHCGGIGGSGEGEKGRQEEVVGSLGY